MVKESCCKIFLTSGITLTVSEKSDIIIDNFVDIHLLMEHIKNCMEKKQIIEFKVVIKEDLQVVRHKYAIPYDRISWYMIEEI